MATLVAAACGGPDTVVLPPEDCVTEGDEDLNGLADCDDAACWVQGFCEEVCDTGWDEDNDGAIACADSDCWVDGQCPELCESDDDEDGDGATGCEDDECWFSGGPCAEVCDPEASNDEDGDGQADCSDADCWVVDGVCPEVCDGLQDEDGDEVVDCEDPDCEDDVACAPTFWQDVLPIMAEYCDDCHTSDSNGELNVLKYDDFPLPSYYCPDMNKGECSLFRIIEPSMPSDCFFCLPQDDITVIEKWLEGGMQEGDPP